MLQSITLKKQGHLLKVTTQQAYSPTELRPSPARRGAIAGFSRKSRKRLFDLINSLTPPSIARPAIFLTLTYPWNMQNAARAKRDLDTFKKQLKRYYPDASAIWRMEYQQSGSIHFHMMIFAKFLPVNRERMREGERWNIKDSWHAIIRCGRPDADEYPVTVVHVQAIRSQRKLISYIAKYLAKPALLDNQPYLTEHGRQWGVHNRAGLPLAELFEIVLAPQDVRAVLLLRGAMRKVYSRLPRSIYKPSFTVYSDVSYQRVAAFLEAVLQIPLTDM